MSLIKCSECGAEVSSKARACQKCGAPVRLKRRGGCSRLLLIVLGVGVVGAIVAQLSGNKQGSPGTQASTTAATSASGASSSGTEPPQTDAEKKREADCHAWLIKAAALGLIPTIGVVYVGGEPGVLVNPGPWATSSFDVKQGLVDAYECLAFKGRDERTSLTVLDALTHKALAYYNGVSLTVN